MRESVRASVDDGVGLSDAESGVNKGGPLGKLAYRGVSDAGEGEGDAADEVEVTINAVLFGDASRGGEGVELRKGC